MDLYDNELSYTEALYAGSGWEDEGQSVSLLQRQ
ncbi:Uncharacterised protein [Enterobacter cancerogenus]|uniref:Uncharacterized protein n=1 Tax=Enterobacter cancerogenus TaxID=69218 RepID=A0A484Z9Z6_9ENTR|nr:Uncharacterised protein [Enterobacter cancerogenus]